MFKNKTSPQLLFIVATHGNEGYSLALLQKLEREYPKEIWGYDWIVGNPQALDQNVRFTDADLNRVAPGDPQSSEYEKRRAAEVISFAQKFDLIIDIHGMDSPGLVKIIPYPTLANLALAGLFPNLVNVIWYSPKSAQQGPLTQFVGKPALEIECDKNDPQTSEVLYQSLVQALRTKQSVDWLSLITTLNNQTWYQVVGQLLEADSQIREMEPLSTPSGIRYPFLLNSYRSPAAYLLEKIDPASKYLYF